MSDDDDTTDEAENGESDNLDAYYGISCMPYLFVSFFSLR